MTSKGHIYMIWTPLDNSFCYIGSTFNRLAKRWQGHKDNYKSKYDKISIHKYFDKYGVDNFKLDLIKSYDCVREHQKDFKHLHAYETLWINKTKNCINKFLPFSPMKYLNRKECCKKYYKNNTDKCKEINKKYYELNKDSILNYLKNYREENKDSLKEEKKKYYQKNKEKIFNYKKQKITCECGSIICKGDLSKHIKTKKHQKFLENQKKEITKK